MRSKLFWVWSKDHADVLTWASVKTNQVFAGIIENQRWSVFAVRKETSGKGLP